MVIYNRLKDGGGFESYELERFGNRVIYRLVGTHDDWETLPPEWRDDVLSFLVSHMRIIIQHLREGDMSVEDILNDYCFSQQREEK